MCHSACVSLSPLPPPNSAWRNYSAMATHIKSDGADTDCVGPNLFLPPINLISILPLIFMKPFGLCLFRPLKRWRCLRCWLHDLRHSKDAAFNCSKNDNSRFILHWFSLTCLCCFTNGESPGPETTTEARANANRLH